MRRYQFIWWACLYVEEEDGTLHIELPLRFRFGRYPRKGYWPQGGSPIIFRYWLFGPLEIRRFDRVKEKGEILAKGG